MPLETYSNSEALFWGQFINVVYQMFENSGGSVSPPQPPNFPAGWKLLSDISADAGTFFDEPELIGVIAFKPREPSKLAIVFRGTDSIWDWIKDGEAYRIPFPEVPGDGWTEGGFTTLYRSLKFNVPDTSGAEDDDGGGAAGLGVTDGQLLTEWAAGLDASFTPVVAGHSLGAAVAVLYGAVTAARGLRTQIYTLAAPQVGDSYFAQAFEGLPLSHARIYNKPDWVPSLPGWLLGYYQVPTGIELNSLNYPAVKNSIYCYHALYTYLYLLGAPASILSDCAASNGAIQAGYDKRKATP
jgi:pimeloyl-ACP methyl ester carboxylesterase